MNKNDKNKHIMLFTALLILLVGLASATEVSGDETGTDSITEEALTYDTQKVSGTSNSIQENIEDKNIQTSKSSDNNLNEKYN